MANPRSHRKNPGECISAATTGQAYLGARVASTVGLNHATHLQVNVVVKMANRLWSAVSKQYCDFHKNPRPGATIDIPSLVLQINR